MILSIKLIPLFLLIEWFDRFYIETYADTSTSREPHGSHTHTYLGSTPASSSPPASLTAVAFV